MAEAKLDIMKAANMAARVYKTRLRYQAPVATGKLKRSIEVVPELTQDGVAFRETYLTYGIYTDSGTRRYYKPNKRAKWNPRPGKGKGGIKPRYWTNINDTATTKRIADIFAKDIAKQIRQSILETTRKNR